METAPATPSQGTLARLWGRIPLLIRAIASGLFVFATLQSGWDGLVQLNMKISPAIPWHVPLGLIYLWALFGFFKGRWGARSTRHAREQSMRARRLNRTEWNSAIVASVAVFIFLTSYLMFIPRLVQVPDNAIVLPGLAWWNKLSILVMIAIVAGVSEEAGFRGYIQGPLERRYGPIVAIGITTTLFWIAHLNDPSGLALLLAILVGGVTFGVFAYCAQSILPGIVVHAAIDIVLFAGSTFEIGSRSLWEPPLLRDSGVDKGFLTMLAVIVLSGIVTVLAMRRLAATRTGDVTTSQSNLGGTTSDNMGPG